MPVLPPQLDGCFIFPIVAGTKDPATTRGWHDASNDPEQIARWERVNPEFNWGVACGLSGLSVYDIDPAGLDDWANRQKADTEFATFVENTFQVQTPKGGLHVYYRGEIPSTASRIAPGIDTRGGIMQAGKVVSGGYVVLPGSRTVAGKGRVDGSYTVLRNNPILDLPAKLKAIVPERKAGEVKGLASDPTKDLPRNVQTARDILEGFVKAGSVAIMGQGGDTKTVATAMAVLSKGISQAKCYDLMQEIFNPHCIPEWEDWELELKILNAYNSGTNTKSGAEGHLSNEQAFEKFAGMETPAPPASSAQNVFKIQFINDYADSVDDPKWLIPGILPEKAVGLLYGASGSYKSFVALDLGMCLATGIPGQWENPSTEKQDVIFFAGESPVGMARLRFPAWMEAHDMEFRTDHRMAFVPRVPLYASEEIWEDVKRDIAEMGLKPCLIMIDTKSRLITGIDENASKDSGLVMAFLERMRDYYNCTILVVDHVGKDASKGARGSSAYYAAVDYAIEVQKMKGGMQMTVKKQKEADTEDAITYFQTKVYGKSIFLKKTADRLEPAEKNGKAVVGWASQAEIAAILVGFGGRDVTTTQLAKKIEQLHGVEISRVTKTITNTPSLNLFRHGNLWRMISGEFNEVEDFIADDPEDEDDGEAQDYDL